MCPTDMAHIWAMDTYTIVFFFYDFAGSPRIRYQHIKALEKRYSAEHRVRDLYIYIYSSRTYIYIYIY